METVVVQCGVLNTWVCSRKLLPTPKGNEYKHAACSGSIKFYGNRLGPYELVWLDSLLHFFPPCFWSCLFMSPVNSHCLYNSSAPFLFTPACTGWGGALPTVKEAYKGSYSQELGCPLFPTLRGWYGFWYTSPTWGPLINRVKFKPFSKVIKSLICCQVSNPICPLTNCESQSTLLKPLYGSSA